MIHTTPPGNWQVFCRPFINFSVALFLFLSGYLTKVENDNWGAFYKKRIIRVIIPYVIWTIIYTLIFGPLGKLPENLLTAQAAAPLYYILVYIQFVLLTPLLGKLAKSKYQFLGWLVTPLSLLAFKYYFLLTGKASGSSIDLLWRDSCLGWFTFYYLGLILGNRIIEKKYSLKVLTMVYLASIVLQMAEGYGWHLLGEKNCGTQSKLSSFLSSSIFMLIAYAMLQNGRYDIKNRFLRMIGDYSFGIYLCHIMMKVLLKENLPLYKSIPYPITSALVILLSLGFCYLVDKVCGKKVSRWLGIK